MPSSRVLVLDLDGTLCLGDAPMRRVAHHAFSHLPAPDRERAVATLARFMAGEHALLPAARDGYDAVAIIATDGGVGVDELHESFMVTREEHELDLWLPHVRPPERLVAALHELSGVERVLVTNSPQPGIDRVVEHLGLARAIDEVITSAHKPNGMPAILDRIGVPATVTRVSLAAIGDRWVNDLAEVHERGGTTFHIAPDAWADGAPTRRAPEPDALAEDLLSWHRG